MFHEKYNNSQKARIKNNHTQPESTKTHQGRSNLWIRQLSRLGDL